MRIQVQSKKLLDDYWQIGLQGEFGVETYTFILDRFQNDVDLSHGIAYLLYQIKDTEEEGYVLLSKESTDTQLEVTWIVGSELTKSKGVVSVQIKIAGLETALWKSEISRCSVAESLTDTSPQPIVRTMRTMLSMTPMTEDFGGIQLMMENPDVEPPITITERKINIPGEFRFIATQNDVDSETVTILLPRFFDGHDLSAHDIYLKTILPVQTNESPTGRDDIYFSDPQIEATEIRLTWVLRPPQTSFKGTVKLQLRVVDKTTGGEEFKWETDPDASVQIYESLDAAPAPPYTPSLMEEFLEEITALRNDAAQSASAASDSEDTTRQYRDEAQDIKDSTGIYYNVQPTRVGFKRANEPDFQYTQDLTGPAGRDGVATVADGMFAFEVNSNGDLIMTYGTGVSPNEFYINSNGDLIWDQGRV